MSVRIVGHFVWTRSSGMCAIQAVKVRLNCVKFKTQRSNLRRGERSAKGTCHAARARATSKCRLILHA